MGISDYGFEGFGFNRAWMYPEGGFTVYPGQPGSCVPSHSDYSKVNWTVPPTVNAQGVMDKLRALGIPQVPPDTIYLGKNPRAAENVQLPIPKGWTPREDEPKEAEPKKKDLDKPKEKEVEKPKDPEKPKDIGKPKEIVKPKEVEKPKPVDKPKDLAKPKDDDLQAIDGFKGKGLDLPKVEPKIDLKETPKAEPKDKPKDRDDDL